LAIKIVDATHLADEFGGGRLLQVAVIRKNLRPLLPE
jgi:hypothetical protein